MNTSITRSRWTTICVSACVLLGLTVIPAIAADNAPKNSVTSKSIRLKSADRGDAGVLAPADDLICAAPCVETAEIDDAAITMPKLADLAVTSAKIAKNAVRSSKILDGSVGLVDVNAAEVQSRVSSTCAAGSSIRSIAQDGTVTCETDDAGGGTATDLNCALQCVQVNEIANGNVTSDHIAENNVRTGDVLDGSLTGNDVENGTIGSLDTNATQVQTRVGGTCSAGSSIRDIAQNGTVTCETDDGGGGTATDLNCAAACVQTAEIADGAVTGAKLPKPLSVDGNVAGHILSVSNTNNGSIAAGVTSNMFSGAGDAIRASHGGQDAAGLHAIASGQSGDALWAEATGSGGRALFASATGAATQAAGFLGNVTVTGNVNIFGTLTKTAGSFLIDHPLDPENKYLSHSFVESPDMMNIYNGLVTTDRRGFATVKMPDWFPALNRSYRYQLSTIGRTFARAVVWEEIQGRRFVIRTNEPRVKVSWQVTGIRDDVYARENPIAVERAKPEADRGSYVYPQGYGAPAAATIEAP